MCGNGGTQAAPRRPARRRRRRGDAASASSTASSCTTSTPRIRSTRTARWLERLRRRHRVPAQRDRRRRARHLRRARARHAAARRHATTASGRRWCETRSGAQRFRHFANSAEPDDDVALRARSAASSGRPTGRTRRRRAPRRRPRRGRRTLGAARARRPTCRATAASRCATATRSSRSSTSPRRGAWYATQNTCPHRKDMVLARGLLGDQGGDAEGRLPACTRRPSRSRRGDGLSDPDFRIATFPVRVEDGLVYVKLPPADRSSRGAAGCGVGCGR